MTSVEAPVADTSVMGTCAELRLELRDLTARTCGTRPVLVSASVAIQTADPLGWFDASRGLGEEVAYWDQPGSRAFVGIGVATSIALSGTDRFRNAAASWTQLLDSSLTGGSAAGRPGAGPILLGGGTFADGPSSDPCWTGFERGRLDVPALLLSITGGTLILTCTVLIDPTQPTAAALTTIESTLDRVARLLGDGPRSSTGDQPVLLRHIGGHPDRAAWSSSVARSAGAVGRGRIDKVVLARRVDLEASAVIDVAAVLGRLGATPDPTTAPVTVFAFTRGTRTFLGASPERLVAAQGHGFRTVALAGTTGRDPDVAADQGLAEALLASEKDREEHAVVVEMLRETLAPVAARLDIDRTPHIVRLPTVQHLASEVTGELRDDLGILDLVARLHPTPAVGGWPRAAALELLDEQEHLDRGWYAAPVGWLDAQGDGEFVVAIRSGVIEGDRASLFVGCGIVGDSEPDREWAESGMKLQSLASALGRLEP
ncbi:MAG: isochorismate synthase [Chloroflexi bacterium]|nr:isochorismate synthase [Chloroflexota bacterium]